MTSPAALVSLFRSLWGRRQAPDAILPGDSWDDLLVQFGLPPDVFVKVLKSGTLHPHFHYRHFTRPKKQGGRRSIHEPDDALKRIQREIVARLLATEEAHPAAVAFQPSKSIANHIWPHAGADVLITADVRDFFPTTNAARVEPWWRERTDGRAARLLTLLTTHEGALPQGAPTSPGLSNLINRELDERLTRRAVNVGARYTRYCDDMVFSWPKGASPPFDFEQSVRAALREFGYTLHATKGWNVHRRCDEPQITGVILTRNGQVRVRDDMRRTMDALATSSEPRDAARLAGYLGFERMVIQPPGE